MNEGRWMATALTYSFRRAIYGAPAEHAPAGHRWQVALLMRSAVWPTSICPPWTDPPPKAAVPVVIVPISVNAHVPPDGSVVHAGGRYDAGRGVAQEVPPDAGAFKVEMVPTVVVPFVRVWLSVTVMLVICESPVLQTL